MGEQDTLDGRLELWEQFIDKELFKGTLRPYHAKALERYDSWDKDEEEALVKGALDTPTPWFFGPKAGGTLNMKRRSLQTPKRKMDEEGEKKKAKRPKKK